eukprot:5923941-Amphidinium_carterae.1
MLVLLRTAATYDESPTDGANEPATVGTNANADATADATDADDDAGRSVLAKTAIRSASHDLVTKVSQDAMSTHLPQPLLTQCRCKVLAWQDFQRELQLLVDNA